MACGVVDETAADYESRSLMQFCKSHLLLLADYELLRVQHMSVTGSESSSSEPDVKSVGWHFSQSCFQCCCLCYVSHGL